MAKKYKYKIKEMAENLPRHITTDILVKELGRHNVSRDSFYRDQKIALGSDQSIPLDRMDAYATVFGCTIEDLKNYMPKGKSIIEVLASKSKAKSGLKTGLK